MFELPLIQASLHLRTGSAQWLSEAAATAGVTLVVVGSSGPNEAAWEGVGLDRRSVLVYGLDIVCQSCHYDSALPQ